MPLTFLVASPYSVGPVVKPFPHPTSPHTHAYNATRPSVLFPVFPFHVYRHPKGLAHLRFSTPHTAKHFQNPPTLQGSRVVMPIGALNAASLCKWVTTDVRGTLQTRTLLFDGFEMTLRRVYDVVWLWVLLAFGNGLSTLLFRIPDCLRAFRIHGRSPFWDCVNLCLGCLLLLSFRMLPHVLVCTRMSMRDCIV